MPGSGQLLAGPGSLRFVFVMLGKQTNCLGTDIVGDCILLGLFTRRAAGHLHCPLAAALSTAKGVNEVPL